MIRSTMRTEKRKDGSVRRRLYVRCAGESVGPLQVVAGRTPEIPKGMARTGEVVRVNRSGTWAVWSATDVRVS